MNKEKTYFKLRIVCTILIILCISTIIPFGPLANAVPLPDEIKIQEYKIKIAQATNERMSPKKQLEIGIKLFDIVCFNETIPILKLSENKVACVKSKTADNLMERYWGVVKSKELSYGPDYGCFTGWSIHYDKIKPSNSTIILTIRNEIKVFSEEMLWQPIIISFSNENILFASLHGTFQISEISSITEALEKVNFVSKAEYLSAVCN